MVELEKDELWNLGKVWASVFVSLTYCHVIGKITPKGFTRLMAILPVISLFLVLPLNLTSINFCGPIAFIIAWLANFKLVLFAFEKPPLWLNHPVSFIQFLTVASFPIAVQSDASPREPPDSETKGLLDHNSRSIGFRLNHIIIIKGAILILVYWILYHYSNFIHKMDFWPIYVIIIYFQLELILGVAATVSRFGLGLEMEPQFNNPLSSTSLQNFWGKRWNLIVTNILRPTVYHPSREFYTKIIGRKIATYPAVMTTFMVSAIMHELIIYHMGRLKPTFEITWFFLLHGALVCLEIAIKKLVAGRWELPRLMSRLLTLSCAGVSFYWLFLPPFIRFKFITRMTQEYASVYSFLRSTSWALW